MTDPDLPAGPPCIPDHGVWAHCPGCAHTEQSPAHDGGPTVQEATADDRAHWTNKHAGEGQ